MSPPLPPLSPQNSERCGGEIEEDRRKESEGEEEEEESSFEIKENDFHALQLCCLKELTVSDLHLSTAESL